MLLRLKEDFIKHGNSKIYRKGELVSAEQCLFTDKYIITRYIGLNNWIKDILDREVVEIIG